MCEVSVIVPCFNEEDTISLLLEAIYEQNYPRQKMEVIIADGISSDGTREKIETFRLTHPDLQIKVIDNYKRNIPSGLNCALKAASGQFIIRLDAHSIPTREYIGLSINRLKEGRGDIIGGVWEIRPGSKHWISRSIAVAASHPFGVGDARYRVGGIAHTVDTVPFGAYERRLIDRIGTYNETLLSNEDYEFNVRARQAGGVIWMDPQISSIYFSRPTYKALAKQYWRYGYWKLRMLLRYPWTFRWRQLAGVFVLTWPILGLFSIWYPLARWLLFLEACTYGAALLFAGIQSAAKRKDLALLLGVPVAIATMHFSWGSAFLWSAIESLILARKKSKLSSGD